MSISGVIRNAAIFIVIFSIAFVTYLCISTSPIHMLFPVKKIVFIGNKHLTDDELRVLAGIETREGLVTISNREISERLLKSPWIKAVSVRKDFPETLTFIIDEAAPFALLDMNGHVFLIDENGKLIEELKDNLIPFLPIITGDPFKEREGFSEAVKLAKQMNDIGFSSERDHIEISVQKPHEIAVAIDGTIVKIGSGGYEEKLKRFIQLEKDIKNLGIPVDYIDLRFTNEAIVKPIKDKVVE